MSNIQEPDKKKEDCHGGKGGHSGFKHGLMMLLCCLVPLGLAFALNAMGYGTIAGYLVFLLCPLMHIFMMRGMFKGKSREQDNAASMAEKGA
ncbi:DUF2933 domain-containing protein [Anaeroselena agilis]|uniref:DUF2933 domain-containing protein n=1 Tax=Anaeroselena agilis TaxID=3063788 RepID=A0ABU3NS52_9FIRM|nr:DUF2933 domain-containing protein [Selenomonadales bacterium 4137-cl]